jgi:hypothetical protein
VPEQRLLSPDICRWRRWSCRILSRKSSIILGFSGGRLFIGGGAVSEGHQGGLTTPGHGRRGRAPSWWACPLAPSGSLSVLVLHPGKIGVLVLVSSNSKNISCVAFLKHKNGRKQGTGSVASFQ